MQITRERILKIVQEQGRVTVEDLSRELGLTSATVRHHLGMLQQEGLIETPALRRRSTPGRPQYIFKLTEAAARHFPKNYAGLAKMLLTEIHERLGRDELDRILQNIGRHIAAAFSSLPGEDFDSRVNRALQFLNDMGYMARCTKSDGEYTLHVTNCLYRDVAQAHAQLCKMDQELVTQLLQVTPRQHCRTGEGDNVCIYHFSAPTANGLSRPVAVGQNNQ